MWELACVRGQYSDAVLSELESQNDEQVEGMSARVKALKDVSLSPPLRFLLPPALFTPPFQKAMPPS